MCHVCTQLLKSYIEVYLLKLLVRFKITGMYYCVQLVEVREVVANSRVITDLCVGTLKMRTVHVQLC